MMNHAFLDSCRLGLEDSFGPFSRMTQAGLVPASLLPVGEARPLHLLWSVERALRLETRAVETRLGVSAAQLWALYKLAEQPTMSVSALALQLGTHQSSASIAARQLEARGLLVRERSLRDRRQIQLRLSDAGRRMLEKLPLVLVRTRLEQALLAMPPDQQRELSRLLEDWLRRAAIVG